MGRIFRRIISGFLTAVFVISAVVTGTYSWQSLQTVTNETAATIAQVQLLKLQKLPDGTETDIPVSGAAFYLFTAQGQQIGSRMVTDEAGTISLRLPAGEYYFEEDAPPPGYTFDTLNGEEVVRYPFVLPENSSEQVKVTAYNIRQSGSLIVSKTVRNADGSPLSDQQLAQDFTFTVTFSDGGTYEYRKQDGSTVQLSSGGTLTLCHGETAVFEDLPVGLLYTITEAEVQGFSVTSSGHQGTIGDDTALASFVNIWSSDPTPSEEPIRLTVEKELAGEHPAADLNKEFEMTLFVNGEPVEFSLKPGESETFELHPGDRYEIREKDYIGEGYSQSIASGFGTAGSEDIAVTVTNSYTGTVMKEISGEKTWQGNELTNDLLPQSITLLLKDGDRVVEEAEVTPDENGRWVYQFTAPKYDADGHEIAYTLEELPLESFRPSYNGFDVVNTYLPPVTVTLPAIVKAVEGDAPPEEHFTFCMTAQDDAPMPEGVNDRFLTLQIAGSGEVQLGSISYTETGVYRYTVTETAGRAPGWIYDSAVYNIIVTVVEENGVLRAETVITKDGKPADSLEFVNRYDSELPTQDMTVVEGKKIWRHGNNPEENRPDSIVVIVYGDGEVVQQQLVTASDGWQYRFELPKYNAEGREIVYTVDEADVAHYEKTIDGYDLINTYQEDDTGLPGDSGSHTPPTGHSYRLRPWLLLMLLSGGTMVLLRRFKQRE